MTSMATDSNRFGDLYVMQAQCGLVKVGRSVDPENRCIVLMEKLREPIVLVAVLPGRGVDEEAMHIKLKRHRVTGEWFYGTEAGKAAIVRVLGLSKQNWPFAWDAAASDELRRSMEIANYRNRVFNRRRKLIAEIVNGNTDRFTNAKIWSSLDNDHITRHADGASYAAILGGNEQWPLPDYLADPEAARSLGPPGWTTPPSDGSSAKIVVAALEALSAYQRGLTLDDEDQW